jgi:PAS domain S-box-containing protein
MAGRKHSSLDRVLGRLDTLDSVNLANLAQRLARERGQFEAIFNTIHEGILVISADGVIEYANAAASQLFGIGETELAGATLWRLVPGLHPSLEASLPGGGAVPIVAREIELSYPQPRIIRLYITPFQVEGSREKSRRFTVILTDVTREKQTTERLIEDEKTSSVLLLAAGVAHELGNPLNSLTIHLQLIARKLKKLKAGREGESLAESIAVCQDEVKRLDGIITHFLEAIRPQPPDLAETNVVDVLDDVLRFQAGELRNRRIKVEAETQADLPVILADRNQLKQVFFNLISNAIEAMEPGGRLKIRSRADDDSVYLMFGDSGVGINQEDLMRLFQPYFTTKAGGHGLGLMLIQRIMRAHGGQVGIDSKEGVGTVVTLTFPQKNRRVRMLESGEDRAATPQGDEPPGSP